VVNRDEAHGRGDHALMNYLTTETDPLWSGEKIITIPKMRLMMHWHEQLVR
jgi:hypothetical protein